MKIGLIDVDNYNNLGECFPNLVLMKLSAWHKARGDSVEFYDPLLTGHCDKVYLSKVFNFTPDYPFIIDADEIIKGGSGYAIETINGKETYNKNKDKNLPAEIEHIYPDYELYNIKNTAYGFLTRGCPRGCSFCHVANKEGLFSYKVANLAEFWRGQKNIILCDPNILACKDWRDLLQQLINSGATIDINQGLDIRLMTPEKAEMIKKLKIKTIHFAWDRFQDKKIIEPKLKEFKEITGLDRHKVTVYILSNYDTTLEQDLERIYFIRDLGFSPYLTIYNKPSLSKGHEVLKLARWVNNRVVFNKVKTFEEYKTSNF